MGAILESTGIVPFLFSLYTGILVLAESPRLGLVGSGLPCWWSPGRQPRLRDGKLKAPRNARA